MRGGEAPRYCSRGRVQATKIDDPRGLIVREHVVGALVGHEAAVVTEAAADLVSGPTVADRESQLFHPEDWNARWRGHVIAKVSLPDLDASVRMVSRRPPWEERVTIDGREADLVDEVTPCSSGTNNRLDLFERSHIDDGAVLVFRYAEGR
jgi:hypothetical protein